jgi:hypothetical protein
MLNAGVLENISNFTSQKTIYDIDFQGDLVWVATSGGLFSYNIRTGTNYLRPCNASFPDPTIRALTVDSKGNLWAASNDGYLLKVDQNGNEYTNSSYNSAKWQIAEIMSYESYLIIGADNGVSLFDTRKNAVVKNASQLATLASSQVHALSIFKKRLYAGCELGLVSLDCSVDTIEKVNFNNPSVWHIDSSVTFAVHSFLPDSGKLKAFVGPSARFNTKAITADSNDVTVHTDKPYNIFLPSNITCLKVNDGNKIWIGTHDHFFYTLSDTLIHIPLNGPTFTGVNRIHVDRTGTLWILPFGLGPDANPYIYDIYWWIGINTYNGVEWKKYGPKEHPEMGHMGRSTEASGIMEAQDGSMWFGFSGGSIKHYDSENMTWRQYCNFGEDFGNGAFLKSDTGICPELDWGKCDAIAQDSAGYLWISSWNNFAGSLLCYKPDPEESDSLTGRYRRYPPYGHKNNLAEITAIAVDKEQNIIYGTMKGVVTVVRSNGIPIEASTQLITVKEFINRQRIYEIVALSDGTSLVITAAGVYQYDPADTTLSLREDFDRSIVTLAVENESIYWYGTSNEGLVRYDVQNDEKTYFTKANGLISNQINDVVVDKKNGCVWVASNRGLSRLSLGYNLSSNKKEMEIVFPNPFSRKQHIFINFQSVPAGSEIRIYSLSGNLIGKPTVVRESDVGAYFQWQPPKNISPGTYFYSIVSSKSKSTGTLMLVP